MSLTHFKKRLSLNTNNTNIFTNSKNFYINRNG
ncbi:hypothetical protein SAMN05421593_0819 [Chryseobacterium culicis]|uniref:Uncharacterized protein n=1 Tax=Chryseobacterium culicis TaxID=680127 RepID=A0A1H6H3R6_CHRCI|nr:hypothetical protein SAMN05421593_0819 [Chryseobacterium culicis]